MSFSKNIASCRNRKRPSRS